jgi:hypothetical protein
MALKFISWNLEKRDLVDWALQTHHVDVALFQEYNSAFQTNSAGYESYEAVSFDTLGTAIVKRGSRPIHGFPVPSPHWDFRLHALKGVVYKTTAVATFDNGLTVVSFHGFNGSGPNPFRWRKPEMLVDHVNAVLEKIPEGPCVFSGDFNTWTQEHHDAVNHAMAGHRFTRAFEVPYDDKKTLDLVYTRGCRVTLPPPNNGHHESDHPYMIFNVEIVA